MLWSCWVTVFAFIGFFFFVMCAGYYECHVEGTLGCVITSNGCRFDFVLLGVGLVVCLFVCKSPTIAQASLELIL